MSRRYSRPIQVALGRKNVPQMFEWRGRMHRVVEVQERWRLVGAWWDGEGETTYFRVLTDSGGFYDLGYDHAKDVWTLSEIQD